MPGMKTTRRSPAPWLFSVALLLSIAACASAERADTPEPSEEPEQAAKPAKGVRLFSEEDAERLRFDPDDPTFFDAVKDMGDGPIVEVIAPEAFLGLSQPFFVSLAFRERNAPIDLETLKIEGKKGIWPAQDVTDLMRPFFSETGIEAEVCLRVGRFKLRLELRDTEGRRTQVEYAVEVIDEDEAACDALSEETQQF